MLLQDARSAARHDPDGRIVLLADQDRALWDAALVREGILLLGDALRRGPERPDRFVVQAAIAACHDLAPTYADTDWAAVVSWYDVLLAVTDTPVARLNRAAALAERDGPAAGLAAMDPLHSLAGYPLWHGSRAELLGRLGRSDEARAAYDAALALELSAAQRRHLLERRETLG
jgi:RNA polymerase sigma-70 factor (ECF subfamily)